MTKEEIAKQFLDNEIAAANVARTEACISKVMLAIRKMQDKEKVCQQQSN